MLPVHVHAALLAERKNVFPVSLAWLCAICVNFLWRIKNMIRGMSTGPTTGLKILGPSEYLMLN